MVVIADDKGPELLAGVMGGEHSGCSDETTDVLIETALWDPANIAHTGRKLGISTDARYRFERGVDPAFALPGLELATRLVLEFCGGEAFEHRHLWRGGNAGAPAALPLERDETPHRPRLSRRTNRPPSSPVSASRSKRRERKRW